MRKTLTAVAFTAFGLCGAAIASADPDPGVPPYTIYPPNACCDPGPYSTWDGAVAAQQYQQQQTGGFPVIRDSQGNLP